VDITWLFELFHIILVDETETLGKFETRLRNLGHTIGYDTQDNIVPVTTGLDVVFVVFEDTLEGTGQLVTVLVVHGNNHKFSKVVTDELKRISVITMEITGVINGNRDVDGTVSIRNAAFRRLGTEDSGSFRDRLGDDIGFGELGYIHVKVKRFSGNGGSFIHIVVGVKCAIGIVLSGAGGVHVRVGSLAVDTCFLFEGHVLRYSFREAEGSRGPVRDRGRCHVNDG